MAPGEADRARDENSHGRERYLVYDRAAVPLSAPASRLSAVIVTFNSRETIERTLGALLRELTPGDEVVVVDNASTDGTPDAVKAVAPVAKIVQNDRNEGFAAACNSGVDAASGDLVVLLNPDATVAPGFGEAIRRPLTDKRGWDAWMALVTCEHGSAINTSGGVVHFTGIAWAGESGEPVEHAPDSPREVGFVSGACLAIPRETWLVAGGFPSGYFLYHEDVDLSLRLRLRGGQIGVEPAARVDHEYEFEKGQRKWRLLERNRWSMVLRVYPGPLLALLVPALLATELALVGISLAGGWAGQKALAWLDVVRALPRLMRERRAIQAERRLSPGGFAVWLTPDLDSAYLGGAARSRLLRRVLRLYWGCVLSLLRARSARR
jgi:N-acetylglucosaminyl-diphospho-decaprenol L-rhamnosyltransferase